MFTIQYIENQRWEVLDSQDGSVFQGTIQECEDWLDMMENQNRKTWFQRLLSIFHRSSSTEVTEESKVNEVDNAKTE